MKLRIVPAAAIAVALSAPIHAQDMFAGAFNGPYGGVFLGYADYDLEFSDDPVFSGTSIDISGAEFGVYGGYGRTFDRFYLAGEVEFGGGPEVTGIFGIDGLDLDVEQTYGVSVLAGYVTSLDTLLYARIGYQRAEVRDVIDSRDENFDGVRYGAGAEYAVTENVRLRGEYVFTDYGNEDIDGTDIDVRQNLFRVGLAYEF